MNLSANKELSGKELIWLLVAGLAAVLVYACFSWGLPWRFNSPDEAANAFWSSRVAQGQTLFLIDPLNSLAGFPVLHPRSAYVQGDRLLPGSFLGLPLLAGAIGQLAGLGATSYVTVAGALLGLICWYLILRHYFNRRVAVVGFVLVAALPGFWYYHARSWFHNGLFVDLVLAAWYASLWAINKKSRLWHLLSGVIMGLSLTVRSSEVFWITAIAVVWFGSYYRQLSWSDLLLVVVGGVVGFSPVCLANISIYGVPLALAYQIGQGGAMSFGTSVSLLGQLILPFGFHPHTILWSVGQYLIKLQWWWFILVAAGWLSWWRSNQTASQEERILVIISWLAAGWLVILYGSWLFYDNPDQQSVTIGTSYVRYWLPAQILLLWPAAKVLGNWLNDRRRYVALVILLIYAGLSAWLVLWQGDEGLFKIRNNIKRFATVSQQVRQLTEPNSVIVSGRTDKFFWPERRVMFEAQTADDLSAIVNLLRSGVSVYWFHPTWTEQQLLNLQQDRLSARGLTLTPLPETWDGFTLYRFSWNKL